MKRFIPTLIPYPFYLFLLIALYNNSFAQKAQRDQASDGTSRVGVFNMSRNVFKMPNNNLGTLLTKNVAKVLNTKATMNYSIGQNSTVLNVYNPLEVKARVREVNINTTPNDINLFGIAGGEDDYSLKFWAKDRDDVDGTDWIGGNLLTHDFSPPGNTADFNSIFYQHTFTSSVNPTLLDIKIDAWEDESPDQLLGIGCSSTRGAYETGFCCGGFLFGLCLGVIDDDDNRCEASPFISGIDFRLGKPGEWYNHGQMAGVAANNNFYKPHIETYWQYTKGTSLANPISLGTIVQGGYTVPEHTTFGYGNSFVNTAGNDVIYSFTATKNAKYDFSLCNSTNFDSQIFLINSSGTVLASNDDFCNTQSSISNYDLTPGQYFIVVSAKNVGENGNFMLNISVHDVIWHVKPTGNDVSDGFSWSTAFRTLQHAIGAACPDDEIWVAAGTYYPDEGGGQTNNDRNAAFAMKNGVAIYGGFPNTSNPTMADRNWATNPTVLSGDIDQSGTLANNSFTVVNGSDVGNSAIMDGFIITGGNADGPYLYSITPENGGGGIYNKNGAPVIMNCIFSRNAASYEGGGMYNETSSPMVINSIFVGNSATVGGGMRNQANSTPILINCTFLGNTASNGGGIFNGNSTLSITNSIIWGNSSSLVDNFATSSISNSIIEGGYSACNTCPNGDGNANPLFVDATGGNLRLQACSPAINAGNNSLLPNGTTHDLAKQARLFNNGIVDLGPYEYQGNAVKPTATINPSTTQSICQGQPLNLTASGGSPFSWSGSGNFSSTQAIASLNTSSTNYSGVYKVTVGSSVCTATATVSVNIQQASVSISPNPVSVCLGETINLSSSTANGYSWKGPNGFSSSQQNISSLYSFTGQLGIYSLTVTVGNCTASTTAEVKSKAQLNAGVQGGLVCIGGTIQLTASGMNSYSWTRPANNFSSTLQNPVIPSAKLTDAGGYLVTGRSGSCTGSAMVLVLVTSPAINPAFTVSPSNIAQGAAITLSATSATGSYSWSGPNGFSGSTRSKTINSFQAVNNGVYRLTLTSGLCKGYTEKTIVIGSVATRLANAEQEEEIAMQINAYPNPVTHTLMVEVILQKPSKLSLKLFNSIGKESGKWQLNEETLLHQTEIDMTSLTGGIYLLQAQAGKQKAVKRVVKIQD